MGLITKKVMIKWEYKTKKWYESKGYIFTQWKDEFEVRVEDLQNGSHVKVNVLCDGCGELLKGVRLPDYLRRIKKDGKYYCKKCANKLFGREKDNRIKLINSKSFAEWGINSLERDFLDNYFDWSKNNKLGINPWNITYGSDTRIWIKCQEKDYHGSYDIKCNNFVNGSRCPYCNGKKVHPLDSLGTLYPKVLKIWLDKNEKSSYDYMPKSNKKVWWKCPDGKHEDYFRSISGSVKYNFRCPECTNEMNSSFLQQKVVFYLESLNFTILHEFKCSIIAKNPKIKNKRGRMPYDNELKELKLLIETQGKQHTELSWFHYLQARKNNTTPEYELHYQKLKDRYKRIFAKSQGYFYLEIPYTADDKEETYKKLINEEIEYINNINGKVVI